jgi:hypothetical protein
MWTHITACMVMTLEDLFASMTSSIAHKDISAPFLHVSMLVIMHQYSLHSAKATIQLHALDSPFRQCYQHRVLKGKQHNNKGVEQP